MGDIVDEKIVAASATSVSEEGVGESPNLTSNGNVLDDGLQRGLKGRHLQMIALGGVVGPSIWYGTGYALTYSGPVGALLCFFIVGIDVYFVMQSLGEMSSLYPTPGAFIEMSGRFVDPALSFALGWNYWYLWITNLAGEYNSGSIIMGLWSDRVPSYGFILILWAFFQCTSILGVTVYGEMEFWLASWKFMCVLCAFLVAILINTGAIGGEYIGFRYWKDPGLFVNGIDGFGQTLVLAAVYYCGTEMMAITAGESQNPKRDLPKAIKQTFWRILIVFIGLVFFSSIICPSNSSQLLSATTKSGKSPFTIALVNAGWPGAGNLVNVVIITALLSSANSSIYICSRTLVSLSKRGHAPAFFGITTTNGVPLRAVIFSNFLGLLALMNYSVGAGRVFTYLVDISGSATFIAWACIGITHIRFRRGYVKQGFRVEDLPYKALWYPYGAYLVAIINIFFVLIYGYQTLHPFEAVDFVLSYIVIMIFVVLGVFWKFWTKTKVVKLEEMDLVSGRRDDLCVINREVEDLKQVSWPVRVKRFFLG